MYESTISVRASSTVSIGQGITGCCKELSPKRIEGDTKSVDQKAQLPANSIMMMIMNNVFVKMTVIIALLFTSNVTGFQLSGRSDNFGRRTSALSPINKLKTVSNTKLHMDATLIPLLVGATGLIFAGMARCMSLHVYSNMPNELYPGQLQHYSS